jgi:hypothetical protein
MSNNENSIPFGDYLNNYLNDANVECFKRCVNELQNSSLKNEEKLCINNCFEKFFISYANTVETLSIREDKI